MHNVLLPLSKVYRYVLEQKTKSWFLGEGFHKTYMNLLKMRFEDSLEYELKVVNQIQKLK
jgi:LytS/YehU family sensor histidine kinase